MQPCLVCAPDREPLLLAGDRAFQATLYQILVCDLSGMPRGAVVWNDAARGNVKRGVGEIPHSYFPNLFILEIFWLANTIFDSAN